MRELGMRRPVLALHPGVGDLDLVVASELMEAGRTVANGFVTPERTLMIASTHRAYLVSEKTAMADGRYDAARLIAAVEQHARGHLLFDMEAASRQSGAMINAVMLGAIAGCGRLPIPSQAFEEAIRRDGKAVDGNVRGFRAGLEAARASTSALPRGKGPWRAQAEPGTPLEDDIAASMPPAAHEMITQGAHRLVTYQDVAYAWLYLDRLRPIRDADDRSGAGGRLLRETARHLALRMSYEDVIRVAEAKTDPARIARIAQTMGVAPNQPFTVSEFLKPGIEELCSLLPRALARRILALARGRDWIGRLHWGMQVAATSIGGYLRLRLLAKLRPWRRRTFRYGEEQAAIEQWLATIIQAAELSGHLALEIAECARLIKGYGDTLKRGVDNYRAIERRVIRPSLAGSLALERAIDAVASARAAALLDPEGEGLARCLDDLERHPVYAVAAE
jgi:indolepyruvate ferredoxin oxidoreductase beta subunit